MVSHMKTTVNMPDTIFHRTKALARRQRVAMRELITEGLLIVLERKESETRHPITPVTFNGKGLSPEFAEARWPDFRRAIYEDRSA